MSNKIDISGLTPDEQCFSVCRSLTKIFALSNRPRSIEELHKGYLAVCGHVKRINDRDPTSSIRSYIGRWNKLARQTGVGKHEKGLMGCKDTQCHRICRKAMEGCGTRAQVYFLHPALHKALYNDQVYTVASLKNVTFIRSPDLGKKRKQTKQHTIVVTNQEYAEEIVSHETVHHYPIQELSPSLSSSSGNDEFDDIPIPAPFFDYKTVRQFTPTPPATTMTFMDVNKAETMQSIEEKLRLRLWTVPPETKVEDNDSDADLDFPSDFACDLDFPSYSSSSTPVTPESVPSPHLPILWSL